MTARDKTEGLSAHIRKLEGAVARGETAKAQAILQDMKDAEREHGRGYQTVHMRMTRKEYDYYTERYGSAGRGICAVVKRDMESREGKADG